MTVRAFRTLGRGAAGLAGIGLGIVVMAASAAKAQYVEYYHAFGEWTVICALDEPSARTTCRLGAPEPSLGSPTDEVRVDIVEPPAGETALKLHINLVVDASQGISLTVDGNPSHDTALARTGEAGWRGAAAGAILDEMAKGRILSIRFIRQDPAAIIDRRFALGGFPSARQTYLQRSAAAGGVHP